MGQYKGPRYSSSAAGESKDGAGRGGAGTAAQGRPLVLAPKIGRSQAALGLVRPPAPRKRVNEFLDARLQDAAKRNEQRRAGSLLLRRTVLVLVLVLALAILPT